jgi:hypothetical protein
MLGGVEDKLIPKYFSMIFSAVTVLVTSPMIVSIIMFESNCHNRTLINRLDFIPFVKNKND